MSTSIWPTDKTKTITTTTITFRALTTAQIDKFDFFLRTILWEETLPGDAKCGPFEVHRLKARIPIHGSKMLLIQGVRNIYDTNEVEREDGQSEDAKLVLIGKGVDQKALKDSLLKTLAS